MKNTTLRIKIFTLTLLCAFTFTILNESVITEALTIDQTASPSEAKKEEQGSITGKVQGVEKTFSLVAPRAVTDTSWDNIGKKVYDGTTDGGTDFSSFRPSGAGTEASPYELSQPEQLAWFSYAVNNDAAYRGAHAKVTADIDMQGVSYTGSSSSFLPWIPVGLVTGNWKTADTALFYSGTFDGGNHVISHLYTSDTTTDVQKQAGLFGSVNGGTIKNVILSDVKLKVANGYAGGIAAVIAGGTQIHDCLVKGESYVGDVSSNKAMASGGIAGVVGTGENRIARSSFQGWELQGYTIAGGIAGDVASGNVTVADCFATSSYLRIVSNNYTAGIVGHAGNPGSAATVINSYASYKGESYNSKIAGIMHSTGTGGTVNNCYYDTGKTGTGGAYGTGLSTADMKSGKLTGLLNSRSSDDGTTETDALRTDRIWYSDFYYGIAGEQKDNEGYPDLTEAGYRDWADVAAEMMNTPGVNGSDGKPMKGAPPVENGGAYEVYTGEQLAWFSRQTRNDSAMSAKNLLVKANLDIGGAAYIYGGTNSFLDWKAIGVAANPYSGQADGGNFTVSGLHITSETEVNTGLFGVVGSGTPVISNFILSDGYLEISNRSMESVGALIGLFTGGTVTNCMNKSVVIDGKGAVGGLIGRGLAGNGVISQCANRAAVTLADGTGSGVLTSYVGGIIGYADSLKLCDCYNLGSITDSVNSAQGTGGITGVSSSCTYDDLYNAGTVTGTTRTGSAAYLPIIGGSTADTVKNCYYLADSHNTGTAELTGLTDAELKSWTTVWTLNNKTPGVWGIGDSDNRQYPMLDGDKGKPNCQQLGEAAAAGLIAGYTAFNTSGNTESEAYMVETLEQLCWFLYQVNTDNNNYKNKYVKLKNDISLTNAAYGGALDWVSMTTFSGVLDGGGFAIGNTTDSFIQNLTGGTVKKLRLNGTVPANAYDGGFVARADSAVIDRCVSNVVRPQPTTRSWSAGVVYEAYNGTVISRSACLAQSVAGYYSITSDAGTAAGICGILGAGCTIRDCYNRGDVRAKGSYVGGICARNSGTIENCYSTGTVSTSGGPTAYGIAKDGTITNSYHINGVEAAGSELVNGTVMESLGMVHELNNGRTGASAVWGADYDLVNNRYPVLLGESEAFTSTCRDWQDVGSMVDVGQLSFVPSQSGADEANAIQLTNPEQLAWFLYKIKANTDYQTKFYKLTADMDMSGFTYNGQTSVGSGYVNCLPWIPGSEFKGTLDGQNYTVSNLYLNASSNNQGFFGQLNGASLKNLTLKSGYIKNTGHYTGGFAGVTPGTTTLTNCHTEDLTVDGQKYVGGFIGEVSGTVTVSRCSAASEVKGTDEAGGIVGSAWGSGTLTIENSYHRGAVSGGTTAGIFARTGNVSGKSIKITNCYQVGTSKKQISGTNCTVTNCYYDKEAGTTTGDHANAKGMTTLQLQSWYAAWLLNGQKFVGDSGGTTETAWTSMNNTSYPSFGNLAEAADWEDVGRGINAPAAGDGTGASPYQLTSPEELAWFMSWINADTLNRRTVCGQLTAEVDLTGGEYHSGSKPLSWRPIGPGLGSNGQRNIDYSYRGTFDGGGHTVSNMYFNVEASDSNHIYYGLFGMAKNAEIKNMRLEQYEGIANAVGNNGQIFAGVLIGETQGDVTVGRILAGEGSITANGNTWTLIGGLVGNNEDGSVRISESASRATLKVTQLSGGYSSSAYGASGIVANRSASATATVYNSYYAGRAESTGPKNDPRSGQGAAVGGAITAVNLYYDSSLLTPSGQASSYLAGTGVPTSQMQDGYITGRMNSIDSGTGAPADSLRDGRIWYSDHLFSSTNSSKGNKGYPDFTASKYTGWEDVGAEVATAAGNGTYGDIPAQTSFTDTSDGTTVTGYNITKPEQLAWLAYQVNHGITDPGGNNYSALIGVGSSMSLEGSRYMDSSLINFPWTAIGTQSHPYQGMFHGKNCEIKKLYINLPTLGDQGLFGYARGGQIRNTGIGDDCTVSGYNRCGGVAGVIDGASLFHCWNKGDITTVYTQVGGIVGYHSSASGDSRVTQCWNSGTVTLQTTGYVGGVVGLSNYGSGYREVVNCFNTGTVNLNGGDSSQASVAGIVGCAQNVTISLCYNVGTINGTGSTGTYGICSGSQTGSQCFSMTGSAANTGNGWAGTAVWPEADMKNGRLTGALNAWEWINKTATAADSLRDNRLWYQDRSTGGSENGGYPCFTQTNYRNWYEVGVEVANQPGAAAGGSPMKGAQPAVTTSGGVTTRQITTPQQLAWFAATIDTDGKNGNKVLLMNDLSLAGTEWTSDGSSLEWYSITPFTGAFDGQEHTVSGLYQADGGALAGLFGEIQTNGSISRVVLESGSVTGSGGADAAAGALAGRINGTSAVSCINRGVDVTGNTAGGLFGKAENSKITRCGNLASVDAASAGGGVAGTLSSGTRVFDTYNLGAVSGGSSGGIAGTATSNDILRNVYNGGIGSGSAVGPIVSGSGPETTNTYYQQSAFPSLSLTGQTGLTETEMKTGYLTGLLNSMDAETKAVMSSLRTDRIWFNDSTAAPVNRGYPAFVSNGGLYENWEAVGAQVTAEFGAVDGSGNAIAVTKPNGSGTSAAPYEIGTAEQLAWFMYHVNTNPSVYQNSHILLTADIDLTGAAYRSDSTHPLPWVPLGNSSAYFKGVFDGGGHMIDFMYINQPTQNSQGFIGYIDGATVRKVGIGPNSSVTGKDCCASLVARCPNAGAPCYIYDCYNRGTVTAGKYSGTVFGDDDGTPAGRGSYVLNSWNTGKINGTSGASYVGAVVGNLSSGNVINCYYLDTSKGDRVYGGVGDRAGTISVYELTDAYMKSGYLPGKLNSMDGATNREVDSLRNDGRVWGIDRNTANGGYPLFTPTEYKDWAEVGREAANTAGAAAMKGAIPAGDGSSSSPYQISTPEQLAWLTGMMRLDVDAYRDKHAQVTADLDLTGADYCPAGESKLQWVPIGWGHGSDTTCYSGNFNGLGHIISSLYIQKKPSGEQEAGLFGVTSGDLSNIYMADVSLSVGSTSSYIVLGGISGQMIGGKIERCGILSGAITCTGSIGGHKMIGGIVGDIHHGTNYIVDCFNMAAMSATDGNTPGGIFGRSNINTTWVRNCYYAGTGAASGGIYSNKARASAIQNCYYKADVYTAPGASADDQRTGLTESQMKSGMLTGLLNSMDGVTGGETDSLRSDRVWYQDRIEPAFNSGYPMFVQSAYRDWQEVGAEVYNTAGAASGGAPMAGAKPSGNGSSGSPYQIETPEQLAWFMYLTNSDNTANGGACVELKQDIDLFGAEYSGYGGGGNAVENALPWIPVAYEKGQVAQSLSYSGTFAGNGHTVSRLYVPKDGAVYGNQVGMFSTMKGATLTGLKLDGTCELNGSNRIGGIVSDISNGTVISDCENGAVVYSHNDLGRASADAAGIAGWVAAGGNGTVNRIIRCANYGAITCQREASGIVGNVAKAVEVTDCYNRGEITVYGSSGNSANGILGVKESGGSATVKNCYNAGKLTAPSGRKTYAISPYAVTNCYYDKEVSTTVTAVSGTMALDTNRMKAWGLPYLLNGKAFGGVWVMDEGSVKKNDGYPVFDTVTDLRSANDWQEVGQFVGYGIGTAPAQSGGVYQIGTAEQLSWLMWQVNKESGMSGSRAVLTTDLDMTGADYQAPAAADPLRWIPIGAAAPDGYQGTFNGDFHKLTSLRIKGGDGESGMNGFFGYLNNAAVKNLLLDVSVTCEGTPASTAGAACHKNGGVAGKALDSSLIRCGTTGNLTAPSLSGVSVMSGGIVAEAENTAIESCYSRLSYEDQGTSNDHVFGGLAGNADSASTVKHSYYAGPINGSSSARSLVGAGSGSFSDNVYDSQLTGAGDTSGYGVGRTTAQMKNSRVLGILNNGLSMDSLYYDKAAVNEGYPVFTASDDSAASYSQGADGRHEEKTTLAQEELTEAGDSVYTALVNFRWYLQGQNGESSWNGVIPASVSAVYLSGGQPLFPKNTRLVMSWEEADGTRGYAASTLNSNLSKINLVDNQFLKSDGTYVAVSDLSKVQNQDLIFWIDMTGCEAADTITGSLKLETNSPDLCLGNDNLKAELKPGGACQLALNSSPDGPPAVTAGSDNSLTVPVSWSLSPSAGYAEKGEKPYVTVYLTDDAGVRTPFGDGALISTDGGANYTTPDNPYYHAVSDGNAISGSLTVKLKGQGDGEYQVHAAMYSSRLDEYDSDPLSAGSRRGGYPLKTVSSGTSNLAQAVYEIKAETKTVSYDYNAAAETPVELDISVLKPSGSTAELKCSLYRKNQQTGAYEETAGYLTGGNNQSVTVTGGKATLRLARSAPEGTYRLLLVLYEGSEKKAEMPVNIIIK